MFKTKFYVLKFFAERDLIFRAGESQKWYLHRHDELVMARDRPGIDYKRSVDIWAYTDKGAFEVQAAERREAALRYHKSLEADVVFAHTVKGAAREALAKSGLLWSYRPTKIESEAYNEQLNAGAVTILEDLIQAADRTHGGVLARYEQFKSQSIAHPSHKALTDASVFVQMIAREGLVSRQEHDELFHRTNAVYMRTI